MLFEIKEIDRKVYNQRLADFLPAKIIDFHTHVWLEEFRAKMPEGARGQTWPRRVAKDNSIEDLLETYRLMFPHQEVTPVIFGWPERDADLDKTNGYVREVAHEKNLPSLIVTTPEWSMEGLEQHVVDGGYLGLKPYLNWAPLHIPTEHITIYDFLPQAHLEVANEHGWIVILHIPRPARLKDPINLEQMLEIEQRYPNIKLVIAHIGRAYCEEDIGNAFEILQNTKNMSFDFSATTNAYVIEKAIRTVGTKRILFGSDLPILRMRMRRICENGSYINLIPPGLYGDTSGDPHMREVDEQEAAQLTFFMYEELLAFRQAAEVTGLRYSQLEDVFYNNAVRLLEGVKRR